MFVAASGPGCMLGAACSGPRARGANRASAYGKGTQLLHGRTDLFNPSNLRLRRTAIKRGSEAIELFLIANAIHLDASVIFVAHPSPDTDRVGTGMDKPAESDSLHTSRDKPGTRFQSFPRHFSLRRIRTRLPPRRH